MFECGKSDRNNGRYESNGAVNVRQLDVQIFQIKNVAAVNKWYCPARQNNIPISGPLLQQEGLLIAKITDPHTNFKAQMLAR